ncbi:TetR/AcrR family transcriptional regulator C-terminal domain-containing protein [Rhizobium sp. L1K21]|uniref:TetR/AcrR family transcriptional regulator C-terminal domain-containing protein n=1 Tax=Rhizobium sp. L1K21 TaxID=2954933 RepID=UPI00209241ED|nr:TetR/AcrR family transcriptional regulator C-terminal domain-containing protein [Rhizobium sp. L1K21]
MSLVSQTDEFTPRQNAVLEEALRLLIKGGEKALTTAGVARAANCSKESLYKWFGDRDGLLAAMISYQASKVRAYEPAGEKLTEEDLRAHLTSFVRDLLEVLSGEVSLALNRLAIGQASREGGKLGQMMLERGRGPVGKRTIALLEAGRRSGLLDFSDGNEAYLSLYGLAVGDLHVRMLLGLRAEDARKEFGVRAEKAVDAFLTLYGTDRKWEEPRIRSV